MINMTNSLKIQQHAKQKIPGMTQLLSKRPDMFSLGVWPGYFKKAQGAHVWDMDGNRYLDMSISGIGANVLGYADPDVDEAVKDTISNGTSCSLNCPEEVELSDLLCELHPWGEMVRFARSGGEAMAIAVRIARAFTGKDKVAFCGYHGWHDWYLAANLGTENALGDHLLSGLDPLGVPKGLTGTAFPFCYNRPEELAAIVADHPGEMAAVVLEPIRSEPPTAEFIGSIRALAHAHNMVMIVDEISAGFRLVTGGAHLVVHSEAPDIAVFSKALGNGYPIAAVIGRGPIMQIAQKTFISSTNWTERIGPTAALATIKKHRALNVADHLSVIGGRVQDGWMKAAAKHGLEITVGGIEPLSRFAFKGEQPNVLKAYFIQTMLDRGFLASTLFYPMYAHTEAHVAAYLEAFDNSFAEIAGAVKAGDLKKRLRGKPSCDGFKRLT
jgi:glutamate-1-semialdehyde 2,1-aminomutase